MLGGSVSTLCLQGGSFLQRPFQGLVFFFPNQKGIANSVRRIPEAGRPDCRPLGEPKHRVLLPDHFSHEASTSRGTPLSNDRGIPASEGAYAW